MYSYTGTGSGDRQFDRGESYFVVWLLRITNVASVLEIPN